MIVATQYVRANGKLFSQGEIIQGLKPDEVKRLLSLGAVVEIDNAPEQPEEDFPMPEPVVEPEVPQEIDVSDGIIPAKTARKRGRRKTG